MKRILAGAVIGAGWSSIALVADWIPYPVVLLIHWFICPWLMCGIACYPKKRKEMPATLVCFYLMAFATGGAMNAVYGISGEKHSFITLLLCMAGGQLLVIIFFKVMKSGEENKTLFCEVKLKFREKEADTTGIWDTGNRLCSMTKRPVHLMDEIGIRMILEKEELDQIIRLQYEMEEGCVIDCFIAGKMLYRIPFCGIGASADWLFAFEIDSMIIKRSGKEIQINHPLIGVSKTMFCEGKNYRIIINTQGI